MGDENVNTAAVFSFFLAAIAVMCFLVYLNYSNVSHVEHTSFASLNFDSFPPGKFECSIQRVDFDSSFSGTMFVSSGKARIDFPDEHIHVLAKDGTAYIWKDGQLTGLKGPTNLLIESKDSVAVSKNIRCKKSLYVDDELFVLPSEVDFKNIPGLLD